MDLTHYADAKEALPVERLGHELDVLEHAPDRPAAAVRQAAHTLIAAAEAADSQEVAALGRIMLVQGDPHRVAALGRVARQALDRRRRDRHDPEGPSLG